MFGLRYITKTRDINNMLSGTYIYTNGVIYVYDVIYVSAKTAILLSVL